MRALVLLGIMWMIAAMPAQAQQAVQLKQTIAQLEATKRQEKELAMKLRRAEEELKTLQVKATRIAANVQQSEVALLGAQKALHDASVKRDSTLLQFSASRKTYNATVMTLLRMRSLPVTTVLVPPEKQEMMRTTALVVAQVEQALRVQLASLQVAQQRFEEAKRSALAARDTLIKGQLRLQQEQASLEEALIERKKMYAVLSQRHSASRAQAAKLAQTSKNLQDFITKLDQKNRASVARNVVLRDVSRAKGALRTPVAGVITHRFGAQKSENERYRGMVVSSRAGATVVAPYDGEIAYSGSFREYGPMVLIRHSGGYMSLLAGLAGLNVPVGTKVRAGEPVGKMGTGKPNLYVELRARGKPIDPAAWYAKL